MFKDKLSPSKTKSRTNWISTLTKISKYSLVLSWMIVIASVSIHPVLSSSSSDMLFVRHSRSRVRHSNEKDHIRWGLQAFDNLTLDYDGYDNDTGLSGSGGSGGGSQLFGSEFWLTSDNNGTSFFNQTNAFNGNLSMSIVGLSQRQQTTEIPIILTTNVAIVAPNLTPPTATVTPTTQKRRKLHKKKIMENIRKNVDKGLEYLKLHKNLDENLNRIQEDVASQEYGLQNDELVNLFSTTTTTTTTTTQKIMTSSITSDVTMKPFVGLTANSKETKYFPNSWSTLVTPTINNENQQLLAEDDMGMGAKSLHKLKAHDKKLDRVNLNHTPSYDPKNVIETDTLDNNNNRKIDSESSGIKTGKRKDSGYLENSDNFENDFRRRKNSEVEEVDYEYVQEKNGPSDLGPSHSASTSIGGVGIDENNGGFGGEHFEEINLEDILDTDGSSGSRMDNIDGVGGDEGDLSDNDNDDNSNKFLDGVVDGANEDEIYDWDEISRNNRRNLMRGRDVVTKFLQIVETQHLLGSNCEAGTSLNLGEGVVDRYAQDRFRVEAEVAVNRANMLTRIFKMTSPLVQTSVNLLHASVLSMVEFDDDIFAAGNCFDWNQHPSQQGLFCPFAYRLPPPNHGAIIAKDLATEYHYLGNTSEWFFLARKNAEKVIAHNDQYIKAFHLYSNKTDERIEEDTLAVRYEDGRWSKPYYDCGGGNIWMLTYTVPFFGYENGTYFFKGTSGIDIDLRRVDIDQCPQRNTPGTTQPLNIFAGTDKCKQRTTMCEPLNGLGFRRGSYKCVCRKGFYYPDTTSSQKFFNGSLLEEEYEKLMLGRNSTYNVILTYECLPCAEGCDSCEDGSPCIAALNWPMRMSILVLACTVIGLLPPAAWFTFRYQQVKVVRASSPTLLRVIALGAFFIYCTTILMYPNPSLYTCTARIWFREIGFSLTYGALMLKTWRISVIFQVRSAKTVKISDGNLLKRLGIICGVFGIFLLVRTLVSPPDVVVGRTADDLKAFLCKTDWWDYTFTSMEVLFLAWGVRLCIMVRKAPSEFNESRFISMAIYNEFLLTCFLNVSMLFLQSPANPDLLYIIFFCHTQLTVTLLLGLIFGSKVYIVLRSGKVPEAISMGPKSSAAKFNFRTNVRTFANPSTATTSTAQLETRLSDQEALEEIRQLSMQLQRIQELAPPKGVAVMTITSLLEGLKATSSQLTIKSPAMPKAPMNNDTQKYQQNNNLTVQAPANRVEKSINTSLIGEEFLKELILGNSTIKCSSCSQREESSLSCQQLGSPQPEGSISFSNIQLDCMCSQPDDLDNVHTTSRLFHQPISVEQSLTGSGSYKASREKASYSSKPTHQKFHSSSNLVQSKNGSCLAPHIAMHSTSKKASQYCDSHKSSEHFLICDNCKNKINFIDKHNTNPNQKGCEFLDRTSAITNLAAIKGSFSSAGSIGIGVNSSSTVGPSVANANSYDSVANNTKTLDHKLMTKSTDDVTYNTTDDNDDGTGTNVGASTSTANNQQANVSDNLNNDSNGSNTNVSTSLGSVKQKNGKTQQRPGNLVLDLNDRSKYTKEVSV